MSWTHEICDKCWAKYVGDREPIRLREPFALHEVCCWCGAWNNSGIYVRHDPSKLTCTHNDERR